MDAVAMLTVSLEQSRSWLIGLIEAIRDAPLTAPTPNGGNHPHWVLGHVVYSESAVVHGYVLGEPNPLAHWGELFGRQSQADYQASDYPTIDELLSAWIEVRQRTREVLNSLGEAGLDQPSKAPPQGAMMFGTVGKCFSMLCLHPVFHAGQVADARRALGRPPVFA